MTANCIFSKTHTNNFISLKTLVERLQYGRDQLTKFWEKEIEYGNSDKKVKELVNYWKNFKKMPLSKKKTSKKRDAYMVSFNNCQLWWKQNPKKFKEKWL